MPDEPKPLVERLRDPLASVALTATHEAADRIEELEAALAALKASADD